MKCLQLAVFSFTLFLMAIPFHAEVVGDDTPATRRLRKQAEQFPEKVVEVAEGVYTAVGYSVSNVSMIVGDDGVVIIDSGLDVSGATRIAEQFSKLTDKPVKAIIFTHSHGDHTGGASAFFGEERPQIWVRSNFGSESKPWMDGGVTFHRVRGARQGGFKLPPEKRINNGIAPAQYPKRGGAVFGSAKDTAPTHMFEGERKQIKVAGVTLELIGTPGETNDGLCVWFPERKVVFAGDTIYRSFPNLYAIRGTPNRNVRLWADSLNTMLELNATSLVPGHTLPVLGEKEVGQVLTDYRDAVRFVHDKTVEGMNKGLTPDQLVSYVQLPKHLADKDYLQPFYGNVEFGVRTVFNFYLGWFDGNPTNLFRLTPKEEAERMAKLAGGKDKLLSAARDAIKNDDPQWAARLADCLIAIEPDAKEPKLLKADALADLGYRTVTATARNYYLTVARELREDAGEK